MAIDRNNQDEFKNPSIKPERKNDVYISYDSLSRRGEVISVSQSMRRYIQDGFANIAAKKKEKM